MIVCNIKLLNVIFVDIGLSSQNLGSGMQIHFTLIRNFCMFYQSVRRGRISLVIILHPSVFHLETIFFDIYLYSKGHYIWWNSATRLHYSTFYFYSCIEGSKNWSAQVRIAILSAIILISSYEVLSENSFIFFIFFSVSLNVVHVRDKQVSILFNEIE